MTFQSATRSLLGIGLVLAVTAPLHAQRELTKIPDPDPELERRSFQVADGFEVNLFAADPLLAKPIQMNFDPAGRLWVACSADYPQIKPGQVANDKIIVLEDRDGDGRADRTTVFADGLLIPTGVEPGDGGAYVGQGTDLLHLADTTGSGRADRRRVVLSGFGTEDTHHIVHTLRWGPDGMLYFNQSIYIHSHIETPHGVRRLGGGGVWQLRPETMQLEVFLRGFCNPWGHHFDRWGQSFVTDGAYGEGINYGLPGAMYVFTPGATRIMDGLNPGSPKHCGLEILSGRHLPPEWQGNALTNDFRGHRVCRFVLSENGAGYASQERAELIKTNHAAFRPVDVKVGPDGAIYIADWYNPIIQHGEVDFRDPRRDHVHGRIWRVTAKGRPLVPRPQLVGASTEALLEALNAPEGWTRQQAKRVLKERGHQVLPALEAFVRRQQADPTPRVGLEEREHHLLEALWTYQSLDVLEPRLLASLLDARDGRVRAAATRVLSYWHDRLPNALALLAPRVADDHPRVRLEAVRTLAHVGGPSAAGLALQALDRPMDKWLDYALWLTARELEPSWLPAVQQGRDPFGGHVRHLIYALQAVDSPAAVPPLVRLIRAGQVPDDQQEGALAVIAVRGGPTDLGLVFDGILAAKEAPAGRQVRLLEALATVTQQRGVRPAGDLARVGRFLDGKDEGLRVAAVRLAGLWQVRALRPRLLAYARGKDTGAALRRESIDALARLGGREGRDALDALASPTQPAEVRRLAVVAQTSVDLEAAARRAVELLAGGTDGTDAGPLVTAFLQRKNGAGALTAALAGRTLPRDAAKLAARAARSFGREPPAMLVAALSKAGGLATGPRVLSSDEMRRMVAAVTVHANPARGEALFRRKDQLCLKCHAIAGAGGLVGPDLASIGASAPVDYLVESILQPNKAIKENYHSTVVGTKDGKVVTGIKVRETNTQLVLRDAEDREVVIPLDAIEERAPGGSLMPEGLADGLTDAELADLVRFLSELGKVGPYSVSKAPVVRRWQVLEPTPEAQRYLVFAGPGGVLQEHPSLTWSPAYSTVAGALPLADVPRVGSWLGATGFVRCQLECSAAGKVKLHLNSPAGLRLWLDGGPVDAARDVLLDLKPGVHTVTFAVDLDRRRGELRCEVTDAAGSPARARPVAGK